MVNEKQAQYSSALNQAIRKYINSSENLGQYVSEKDQLTYIDFLQNKMLIIQSIRGGMPYYFFDSIKVLTPFSEEEWADYLSISTKTLQRHRKEKDYLFKPIHTEKIIELTEVMSKGLEVFDSSKQFYLWLKTPSYALGKLSPAELLKDSYGKELVMAELNRIEHGIFI